MAHDDNALRRWREAAGLRQSDVVRALSCSKSSLQKWESGQAFPGKTYRAKLARLFGMSEADVALALKRPTKRRTRQQNRDICYSCPVLEPCQRLERAYLPTLCEEPDEAERHFMEDVGILDDFTQLRSRRVTRGTGSKKRETER